MEQPYQLPKVWTWDSENGGQFSAINRPVAGSTHEAELRQGDHPFQLYSTGTPNGVKVTILLEELLALGYEQAQYDAHLINIFEGEQFGSGFVSLNPNSKIPALIDSTNKEAPVRVFESGSILLYLAEKFDAFLPADRRTEVMNWLFWQIGSAPYLGGGFGHFYAYAPEKIAYCIDRFTMEVKRQLDVLDRQLANQSYIAGPEYTIADMAIWPWYGALVNGKLYDAAEFVDAKAYTHVLRWSQDIAEREPVLKGRIVNRIWGEEKKQLRERHSAEDFSDKDLSY